MSVQAASDFLEEIDKDSDLQQKLQKVGSKVTKTGRKRGHDFTDEEFGQALRKRWNIPSTEEATPDTCIFVAASERA